MAGKGKGRKKSGGKKLGLPGIVATVLVAVCVILGINIYPELLDFIGFEGVFSSPSAPAEGTLAVHYIDVGQGDSELIVAPDGTAMLIDAGPNSSEEFLLTYLKNHKIKELEYAIFTHPHEDHIGGGDYVIENIKVKNVIMPDTISTTKTYERLLNTIDQYGCNLEVAHAGTSYPFGGASFEILGPISDDYEDTNDWSIVLRLDFGDTSFMFTGDTTERTEKEMLAYFPASKFKCDVYKTAHHGSTTSNSEAFLNACNPEFAVISCGVDNTYGHPHTEILNLYQKISLTLYRTDRDGSIVFESDGITVRKAS